MRIRVLYLIVIFVSIISNSFAIEIKELYPVYTFKGNFNKLIVNDIYAYISNSDKITVIDTIARELQSEYKPHYNKEILDIVVTKDKYVYILHKDGVETVDFLKTDTPSYIKCLCLPHSIDLKKYNLYKFYLLENKNTLYINYGKNSENSSYLPIDISYRYEPVIKRNAVKSSSYDIISLNSYLLVPTKSGFEILSFTDNSIPVVIGSYKPSSFGNIKALKYENNKAYLQYDDKLDIVDLSYPLSPLLTKTVSIEGKLLSVKENLLFTASNSILKITDITDLEDIKTVLQKDLKSEEIKKAEFYNNFLFILTKDSFEIYSPVKIPSSKSVLEEFIKRLYKNILLREPDPAGFKFWKDALKNGMRGKKIVNFFFNSQELKDQNLNNDEFLKRVYNTVLSRNPDTKGYNYWMEQLDKNMSRKELVDHFTSSKEFKTLAKNYGIQP